MGRNVAFQSVHSYKTRLLRALLFLALWLVLLDFPHEVTVRKLDANWMRCLGHFVTNRFQCGVDYIWTYGPLGYFVHVVYDANLFWWKYAWEIGVKLAMAWLVLRWADVLRPGWTRIAFVGLVLLFDAGAVDALYLFCIVLLGLLPLRDESYRTPGCLAVGTILLAVLSLTKFTFLLVGTAAWIVVALAPGLGWRRRAALAVGYPLAWSIGWMLLGQSLANIPRFLAGSWEIASGYVEGMAFIGDTRTVYGGLTALFLFVALLASYPRARWRRRENLLGLALLSATVFLVWKHGFIRQDVFHLPHFFGFVLLVPFVVEGLLGDVAPPNRLRVGLATALVLIGALGRGPFPSPIAWTNRLHFNAVIVLRPAQLKRLLDNQQEVLADDWALPNIKRMVGQEPADLISVIQGVLLLNHLNYHPRPIIQSYSAYTPDLAERNAAFYRSEHAPEFVLWQLNPIDSHFPTMEDGPAVLEILRRYRPVLCERDFLLFKRLPDGAPETPAEYPLLLQRTTAFGEEIRLDELGPASKLLSVHIEETLFGWLRKMLFRPPSLILKVQTQEDKVYSYRLIPGMAESGFLLDPLILDTEDIVAFYTGKPLRRIQSFSIHADTEARRCFQERMQITVRHAEGLTGTTRARN